MKTIWKYELNSDDTIIKLSKTHKLLHVDNQRNVVVVWAEVDTEEIEDNIISTLLFHTFMTGQELDWYLRPQMNLTYLGTVLLENGSIVVHVYYE